MNTLKLKRRHQQGFTLIEFMIVVTIMAVLAAWATPSMLNFIRKSQVNTEVRSLTATLQETRSEAILTKVTKTVEWSSSRKDILAEGQQALVNYVRYDFMGRATIINGKTGCISLTHAKNANIITSIKVEQQGRVQVFKNKATCS